MTKSQKIEGECEPKSQAILNDFPQKQLHNQRPKKKDEEAYSSFRVTSIKGPKAEIVSECVRSQAMIRLGLDKNLIIVKAFLKCTFPKWTKLILTALNS